MSALERFGDRAIQHIRPVSRKRASGLVALVYDQLEQEFQLAPPLTVHSAAPRLLAAVWSATRETLVVGDGRITKEAVAAAVSAANACPFCIDVHSVMLEAGSQRDVAVAIATQQLEDVKDPQTRALVRWSLATTRPLDSRTLMPPLPAGAATAYAGTAIVFHYINRVVNVFMREGSPLALPVGLGWLRAGVSAIAARTVGRAILEKAAAPGASLGLLAGFDKVSGIAWIDEHPTIGPALSRLFGVAREGGVDLMSDSTLSEVEASLLKWSGEDPPIGRGWLTEALATVRPDDAPAARLALLSARCAYQVGDDDVAAFRARHASDDALVRIVAFGAAAAARRVATWLSAPGSNA